MGRNNGRSRGRTAAGDGVDASALLDRFTAIDEQLEDTNEALRSVVQTNKAIAEQLAAISHETVDLPGRTDRPLVADAVVQPALADGVAEPADYDGNTEEVALTVPADGSLTRVLLSFPGGANQSLGIGIDGVDGENLIPFGPANVNYIALNNDNVAFDLEYDVNNDETLTVRFINARVAENDSQIDEYAAYLSTILTVTEVL